VAITSAPRNGTASAQGNVCHYRPRSGFTGTDTFTLVRRWPEGGSATVTFNVTVVDH
jgi:Bacterial Ig domain